MAPEQDRMDNTRGGHRWRRIGDWPMAVKLIAHTAGLAAALAVGLTAMGYIQAAQGLGERAEAALRSDALVVTTAIDAWNEQRPAALQIVARRHALKRLLSNDQDPTLVKDVDAMREGLSAMDLAGDDVESVVLVDRGGVIMSDPTDEVGGDVRTL